MFVGWGCERATGRGPCEEKCAEQEESGLGLPKLDMGSLMTR